jgi:hypothetical protein
VTLVPCQQLRCRAAKNRKSGARKGGEPPVPHAGGGSRPGPYPHLWRFGAG